MKNRKLRILLRNILFIELTIYFEKKQQDRFRNEQTLFFFCIVITWL